MTGTPNPFPADQIAPRIISQETFAKVHSVADLVTLANTHIAKATHEATNANTIAEAGPGLRENFKGHTGEASDEANIRQASLTEEQSGQHTKMATYVSMLGTSANGALAGFDGVIAEYNTQLAALKAQGDAEGWTQEEFRQREEELVQNLKGQADTIGANHDMNADTIGAAMADPSSDPSAVTGALGEGNAAANIPSGLESSLQGIMGQLTGQAGGAQQQLSGMASKGMDTVSQLAQGLMGKAGGEGDIPITPEALDELSANQGGGDAPADAMSSEEPPVGDEPAAEAAPADGAAEATPVANKEPEPAAPTGPVQGGGAPVTNAGLTTGSDAGSGGGSGAGAVSASNASAGSGGAPTAAPAGGEVQTDLSSDQGAAQTANQPAAPTPATAPAMGGASDAVPTTQVSYDASPPSAGTGTDLSSATGGSTMTAPSAASGTGAFGPAAGPAGMGAFGPTASPAGTGLSSGFSAPAPAAMGPAAMGPMMSTAGMTAPMPPGGLTAPMPPGGLAGPVGPPPVTAPPAGVTPLSAQNPGTPTPAHGAPVGPSSVAPAQSHQQAGQVAGAGAAGAGGSFIGAAPVAVGVDNKLTPSGGYHVNVDTLNSAERAAVNSMRAIKQGLQLAGITSAVAVGVYEDGTTIFTTIDGLGYVPDGMYLPEKTYPMLEYVSDAFVTEHTGCDRPSFVMHKAADVGLIPKPNIILATDRNTSDSLVTTIAPGVLKSAEQLDVPVPRATLGGIDPSDVNTVMEMLTGYWGPGYATTQEGVAALAQVRWQAAMNVEAATTLARYMLTEARDALNTGRIPDACYVLQRALWITSV